MMNGNDAHSRWQRGARPSQFTPAEAGALAEFLVQRHPAYRDRKHLDHGAISAEVRELFERASPGNIGPGGEAP